ncbi:MAG TPA: DUF6321 domain-containing protein [Beijerinckiaceae bacterium]|nr:DUF6321 domain-containing protein [Beijerinckiaceae bacterium]
MVRAQPVRGAGTIRGACALRLHGKIEQNNIEQSPLGQAQPEGGERALAQAQPVAKGGRQAQRQKGGAALSEPRRQHERGQEIRQQEIRRQKIVGQEIIGQEIGDQEIVDEEERGPEILRQEGAQVIPQVGTSSASAHASRSIGMAASKAAQTRDPKGGLTAAGRAAFKRKQGANLKPGVKKAISEMTPDEMRRKGSWAARFYGRETLPPLTKKNGEPTRFALSAAAWGEPVPKTEAAARKIAAKGERLLERYRRLKDKG